ncbi:helix-turn-helix domain-containing protein [Nocardia transvalensis]|nr:helix-turn-helix domain-containing protein [Nocardia transvalensis]
MPQPYSIDRRAAVVAAARRDRTSLPRVALEFGVSVSTVRRWLEWDERQKLRERNKQLDQENEIWRGAIGLAARELPLTWRAP